MPRSPLPNGDTARNCTYCSCMIDAGAANLAVIVLRLRRHFPARTDISQHRTMFNAQSNSATFGVAAHTLHSSERRTLIETRAALFGISFSAIAWLSSSPSQARLRPG